MNARSSFRTLPFLLLGTFASSTVSLPALAQTTSVEPASDRPNTDSIAPEEPLPSQSRESEEQPNAVDGEDEPTDDSKPDEENSGSSTTEPKPEPVESAPAAEPEPIEPAPAAEPERIDPTPAVDAEPVEPTSAVDPEPVESAPVTELAPVEPDESARVSGEPTEDSPPEKEPPHPGTHRRGWTVVPKLGFAAGGWTEFEGECDAGGELECEGYDSFGLREASGIGFALEGLYQLNRNFRFGVQGQVTPSARGDGNETRDRLGTDASLSGVLEGVVDLTEFMAAAARVQAGASMMFAGGRAQEEIDLAIDDCDGLRNAGFDCYVESGPFPAFTYGAGVGFLWPIQQHRLRLDAFYQMAKFTLYRQEADGSSGSADGKVSMDQSRFWLLLGFEISP